MIRAVADIAADLRAAAGQYDREVELIRELAAAFSREEIAGTGPGQGLGRVLAYAQIYAEQRAAERTALYGQGVGAVAERAGS